MIVVIVLLGLLVAADFAAKAFAQEKFASEVQSHGFPKKPDVSIKGFPFLTQVAARDFHQIDISSGNVPEGPVTIKSITAVLDGVHLNSGLNGATVHQLSGKVFISFPELANALSSQAGGLGSALGGSGLTLSGVGSDEVKASLNIPIIGGSAIWRVTEVGGNQIDARLVSNNGLPSEVVSQAKDIKVQLPALPLNLTIQRLSVTPDGITGQLTGHNLSLGS